MLTRTRTFLLLLFLGPTLLAQTGLRLGAIRITGLDKPRTARVLLINARGPGCNETIDLPAAAVVDFADRLGQGCWQRDPLAGLLVLAPGRAPTYVSGSALNTSREITIKMLPRREVRVEVWPKTAEFARAAIDDLANFDWILDRSLAGITLKPHLNPPDENVASITCANADLHQPVVPGAINLFYGGGAANQSCTGGKSSAVLVHDIPVPGDAAHEIGHKLGLNQSDAERDYSSGHTTDVPRFTCDNLMWQKSEILKHTLSIGQAAWLGTSCSSFLAKPGECLSCPIFQEGDGETLADVAPRSACPRFTLGQPQAVPNPCPATCSGSEGIRRLLEQGLKGLEIGRDAGRARLCTQTDLRQALGKRFRELRNHVQGRLDLRLSTDRESEFVEWWMTRIKTIVIIDAVAEEHQRNQKTNGGKISAAEANGMDILDDLFARGPMKGHIYLMYAKDNIQRNQFQPGCQTE